MNTFQDTDSDTEPQALEIIGRLICDIEIRRQWLAPESEGMQRLFDRMFFRIGGLAETAEWDIETLLDELGCRRRTSSQLEALTESELSRCVSFFEWIAELGRTTPTSPMIMRTLISAASATYASSRQDLDACRRAMQQPLGPGESLTSLDLLRLGEVGGAFAATLRMLPGRAGNEARTTTRSNPFPIGHLPAATIDAWLCDGADTERMAIEQRARLDAHIPGCEMCSAAAEHRQAALGLRDRPAPVLSVPAQLLSR